MEIQTEKKLQEVLPLLEQGLFEDAVNIITPLFDFEPGCEEVSSSYSFCMFWIDSNRHLKSIKDPFEKCENLLPEWKTFKGFLERKTEEKTYEPILYAIQKGFFSLALEDFKKLFEEKDAFQKAEAFMKAGICCKELGDYEQACHYLKESTSICPTSAAAIAELADCYCLCGDEKIGKLLFREAFFINPEAIDLDFLKSELIKYVINYTKNKGYEGKQLQYWIPIYGVLNGVFTIKRDLTSQEVAKLINGIFAMESEHKGSYCDTKILVPKLLNNYFWLIDHYLKHHDGNARINEVLLKIKLLDSNIYELYTK